MPPADVRLPGSPAGRQLVGPSADAPAAVAPATVRGWGGGDGARVSLLRVDGADALRAALDLHRSGGLAPTRTSGAIARGMGRSYGDAAQLRDGLVIDTTGLKRMELDQEQGLVIA